MCAYNPGRFFNRFAGTKLGEIAPGFEAKFTIIDFSKKTVISKQTIKSKCGHSPFLGVEFPAEVKLIEF